MSFNKDIKKREDKLLALSFYICVLAVVWILLQIVSFTSFRIPTDSMQPALHPGDNILVNKSIMGPESSTFGRLRKTRRWKFIVCRERGK